MLAGLRVRAAMPSDVDGLFALAQATGGGFTSLPPDRDAIALRLEESQRCFLQRPADGSAFWLALEEAETKNILGCSAVFPRVGRDWPFYSFRRALVSHTSPPLRQRRDHRVLYLSNELNGVTEVGGLFLHPRLRGTGASTLLARSRYLLIAVAPELFGPKIMAELRGWRGASGECPFWDAVGARFFGLNFEQADQYGAVNGNQFIADLLPKYPIYEDLLSAEAVSVIGKPHPASAPALRMLEREGFTYDGLVDVFDAGPCVTAPTAKLESVTRSFEAEINPSTEDDQSASRFLVASLDLSGFEVRSVRGSIARHGNGVKSAGTQSEDDRAVARVLEV